MRLRSLVLAAALVAAMLPTPLRAQGSAIRDTIRAWRRAHDHEVLRELAEFLAIPNLASDSVNIRRNAAAIVGMLERRGVAARLLEAPGSPPAVFGELRVPGATRTVVFYAHYDGQPVDTTQWATAPWTPTLRDRPLGAGSQVLELPTASGVAQPEWRLYARSAGDDKSPIVAALAALDAMRAGGVQPSVNLKFFFEGEEEAGSEHLRDMLTRHRELLAADLWIFGDGPVHQSRRQQVVFGVRGVMGLELTTYGPSRALHSGHYGNWAPNPVAVMANFVSSLRDADGRIRVQGFYADVDPISAAERRALAAMPPVDSALRRELALGGTEANDAPLMERIMLPALNLRGFRGGGVGAGAANAVVTEARASIDFRLVPRQTPARIRQMVEAHARRQGFHIVEHEPTAEERRAHRKIMRMLWESGYPSTRTRMDLPVSRALVRAVEEAVGGPTIAVPTLGGSLPMYIFEEVLRAPLIVLPVVNHDNNQHASNENLRLQNLWDAIEVYGVVFARLGALWSGTIQ